MGSASTPPVGDAMLRRLAFVLLLVVVAVAANYGPISHYVDARGRLNDTAARVAALEEENAQLQAQVGKLNQSGYLEDLARQQLTYALPGEELYIVTTSSQEAADAAAGLSAGAESSIVAEPSPGATSAGAGVSSQDGASAAAGPAGQEEGTVTDTHEPGFFESILLAIGSLF